MQLVLLLILPLTVVASACAATLTAGYTVGSGLPGNSLILDDATAFDGPGGETVLGTAGDAAVSPCNGGRVNLAVF
jgi:hypothetical protein